MSKIISLLPRHYIGTAAEIGGITGVCGDTAYSSDTDVYYHWQGSAWLAGGIPFFVERLTNSPDFTAVNFTQDGNWHVDGLNLQPLVPAGAFRAELGFTVRDDAANSLFQLRRDAAHAKNSISVRSFVANVTSDVIQSIALDADRLLDYNAAAVVFVNIDVTVLGWWMRRCL